MLLIGQPKSASTSLMRTIAEIIKVGYKNGQNKRQKDVKCQGFEETQKYHGTTVKRSPDYIYNWINNKTTIYKEHILPTEHHLNILKKAKNNFVTLIRDPQGVVNAYRRVFEVLPEMQNIDYEKLYEEAKLFYDIYRNEKLEKNLVITFRDIIFNFIPTIMQITKHYGYEVDNINKYQLLKYNFTGQGVKEL
jgi:hypothetical protein